MRTARPGGKVRAARLTDLAALGELSRMCHGDAGGGRSLGLPVAGPPIGMFSLFRLPLGAFRPHDLLYVYEEDGRVAGLVRVERENDRDDWTIVELDAIGVLGTGDIRFRLIAQALREGQKRGATRFHVACADADGNVELFMQSGFARYGEEVILYRPAEQALPSAWPDTRALAAGIRPARALDAAALMSLYAAATPAPVQRLESLRIPDWERQGSHWRVPRSSLAPILRFADIEGHVLEASGSPAIDGLLQLGIAREDQPDYLRILVRPGVEPGSLIDYGLAVVGARRAAAGGHGHGVIAAVRTYEAPVDRRLEAAGFAPVASVTLLLKETLVRVAEPALLPAGVRSWEVPSGS
jgi:hypothetical protein